MITRFLDILRCPACADNGASMTPKFLSTTADGHIRDGLLRCDGCDAWYPILDEVLELVPAVLIEEATVASLRYHHGKAFDDLIGLAPAIGIGAAVPDVGEQLKQREHFDWYADNPDQTYADYAEMPFWRAVDSVVMGHWRTQIPVGATLLDIACGPGRSAFPHAERAKVIGFDISRKAVKQAIDRARREGRAETMAFFVGDAAHLPIRASSIEVVQTYGALHHFPDPGRIARAIQQILRTGGVHLGLENNETVLRKAFDWLMTVCPIWVEEAGEEPLMSERDLVEWTSGTGAVVQSRTMVFLPPHAFNLTRQFAVSVMRATDAVCQLLPFISHQGGLIAFEIRKPQAEGGAR